jgi:hypothetical protein
MECRYYHKGFCEVEERGVTLSDCKKKCEWYEMEKEIKRLEAENERMRLELLGQHLKNCLFVGLD